MVDDARAIAFALSPKAKSYNQNWLTKCPIHADRTASLSVGLSASGRILFSCHAGCDSGEVFHYCKRNGIIEPDGKGAHVRIIAPKPPPTTRPEAIRIWKEGKPIAGTPAEAYLQSRGLVLTDAAPSLRYSERVYNVEKSKHLPAMLALIQDESGKGVGLQRTYLDKNGSKADVENGKMTLGSALGAVMFGEIKCGLLIIGEGIESVLSARAIAERKGRPWAAWAAIGAGTLARRVTPPMGLERIVIAADIDEPGIIAAVVLRQRILDAQIIDRKSLSINLPCKKGRDFNDLWREVNREK